MQKNPSLNEKKGKTFLFNFQVGKIFTTQVLCVFEPLIGNAKVSSKMRL